ncbi:MAG: polysaccharide deacetylase family protein [bacterium]
MFIPILAYHMVHPRFDLGITRVTPRQFERQIKYLFDFGYKTISFTDFVTQEHADDKNVIITFDDAYESVYQFAFPILKSYDFAATIFVITNYVGKWNEWDYSFLRRKLSHCTWEQLENLISEGWEVGSHTITHRNLIGLSDSEAWREVNDSKEFLENQIQKRIGVISYPFGRFNEKVIEFVQKAGYIGGCTLGHNSPESQNFPYAIFRRGVYLLDMLPLFKVKLKSNLWSQFDDLKQKLISSCSQGSILLQYIKSR